MTSRTFDHAKIVNVVDGDTCDIEIDLGFSVRIKQRFRLLGIDTPERGQVGWTEARNYLVTYAGMPCVVISTKIDKYGRFLAEIIVGEVNLNNAMLEKGLAKVYS